MGRGSGAGAGRSARDRGNPLRSGRRFMSGSQLRGVTFEGGPISATSETRLESIRQLFRAGRAGESRVSITVDRATGQATVDDGRHRLLVSREPEFAHVKLQVDIGASGKRQRRR